MACNALRLFVDITMLSSTVCSNTQWFPQKSQKKGVLAEKKPEVKVPMK